MSLLALLAPVLLALGHDVRDGHMPFGKTALARLFGGIACIVGVLFAIPDWWGLALGAAIMAGYWTDMRHGEGQRAQSDEDDWHLMISGVTSLAPVALVAVFWWFPAALGLLALALAKPRLWRLAWRYRLPTWLEPTRLAAVVFGALIGAVIALAGIFAQPSGVAWAHDMNHPDLDGWYASLYRQDGGWCCDTTDCKATEYRIGHDGYEVLIDERFPGVKAASWRKVPPSNVVARENPTGSAVACWYGGEVRCFVPTALF